MPDKQEQDAPKKVAKKPVEKKEPKSTKVVFYWRKYKAPSFTIPNGVDEKKNQISVIRTARNSVMTLDTSDGDDAVMVKYLRKHQDNEANKGLEFTELESRPIGAEDSSDIGAQIDKMWKLEVPALATLAGGGVSKARLSKGTLVAEILDLKAG